MKTFVEFLKDIILFDTEREIAEAVSARSMELIPIIFDAETEKERIGRIGEATALTEIGIRCALEGKKESKLFALSILTERLGEE